MQLATPTLGDLAGISAELEAAHPGQVIAWASRTFCDAVVFTTSFGDATLAHLVAAHAPGSPIVLLDTQYLFAETHWFAEQVCRRFGIELVVMQPEVGRDDLWMDDPDACCRIRKVEPLNRALAGAQAWVTGLQRSDSPSRARTPIVAYDLGRNLIKVNPMATWNDDDVELYHQLHDLPRHPLADRGFQSIGCWPCTRPVAPGDDKRAGRWSGTAKTECGLHL